VLAILRACGGLVVAKSEVIGEVKCHSTITVKCMLGERIENKFNKIAVLFSGF
jgi:hypothetical protein